MYKDEETTREIAREIEERIARIEKDTDIIDTQKNAVIAAFEYATAMRVLDEEHEQDIRELAKALERLTSQLKALTKRFHLETPILNED